MKKSKLVFLATCLLMITILYSGINILYQSNRTVQVYRGFTGVSPNNLISPAYIDAFMISNLKKTGLPGAAMAITKGSELIYTAGYGKDSVGKPITADTRMYIGSVSKSFTSLAVMQLSDQGKIQLDQPVKKYLPHFITRDLRSDKITVSELLNQSSGLADGGFPEMSLPQPNSLSEEMQRLQRAHLVADPGTQWNYHNPNYHILAELIEKVSGQEFNEYLKDNIFDVLHMNSTNSVTTAGDDSDVEDGHMFAYGIPISRRILPHFVSGSGGVISTANDMAKWIAMQNSGGKSADGTPLISKESLEAMHTPFGPDGDYAYGWEQDVLSDGSKRIEHGGTLFTYSSDAAIFPDTGYAFVVMFNSTSATGAEHQSFIDGLTAIVQNKSPELGVSTGLFADSILGALTLLILFFCIGSTGNAHSWVERVKDTAWIFIFIRNLPYMLAILTGTYFLRIAGFLFGGRNVTWTTGVYGWPALIIFVETSALACAMLLIGRIFHLYMYHKRMKNVSIHKNR